MEYRRNAFGVGAPTQAVLEVGGIEPEPFEETAKRYVAQSGFSKRTIGSHVTAAKPPLWIADQSACSSLNRAAIAVARAKSPVVCRRQRSVAHDAFGGRHRLALNRNPGEASLDLVIATFRWRRRAAVTERFPRG
jgi:hypothetical protein